MSGIFLSGYSVISPFGMGLDNLPGHSIEDYNKEIANPISESVDLILKRFTRLPYHTKLACASMQEAARMAGIDSSQTNKDFTTSIIVSTSTTNLYPIIDLYQDMEKYGLTKINPGIFPNTVLNSISGYGAMLLKCSGPNITLSEGATSSLKALEFGRDLLVKKLASRVVICELNLNIPSLFSGSGDNGLINESVASVILQTNREGAFYEIEESFPSHIAQHHSPNRYAILEMVYKMTANMELVK